MAKLNIKPKNLTKSQKAQQKKKHRKLLFIILLIIFFFILLGILSDATKAPAENNLASTAEIEEPKTTTSKTAKKKKAEAAKKAESSPQSSTTTNSTSTSSGGSTSKSTSSSSSSSTPAPVTFAVTGVSVTADRTSLMNAGLEEYINFTATITVNKAGTVTYKWLQNPAILVWGTSSLTFTKAGSKTVTYQMSAQCVEPIDMVRGVYLQTYSPNSKKSNTVNTTVECL